MYNYLTLSKNVFIFCSQGVTQFVDFFGLYLFTNTHTDHVMFTYYLTIHTNVCAYNIVQKNVSI